MIAYGITIIKYAERLFKANMVDNKKPDIVSGFFIGFIF